MEAGIIAASPALARGQAHQASRKPPPSSRLTLTVGDLSVLMGIEEDRVTDLAHAGVIPARLGRRGLSFDAAEVHHALLQSGAPEDVGSGALELRELSLSLGSAQTRSEVMDIATTHLVASFGSRSGIAFVVDPDAWLVPVWSVGRDNKDRIAALHRLAAWVAIRRRPVCIGAPQEAQRGVAAVGHVTATPVLSGDGLFGVIALEAPRGAAILGTQHLALAEVVGFQCASALERVGALQELAELKSHTELNQRQMEAFARDVRATFAAERERAEQLAEALAELQTTYLATVKGLAVAVEAKDEYTAGHLQRVTRYGLAMMRNLVPQLASDPQYEYGFLLHDIGKMGIPDAVLKKEGPLTDEEWEVMRSHSEIGGRILRDIPFLAQAREIVCAHHERWDGNGYPRGLKAEEIPLGARVFAIADSFDAMRSDRPYRKALSTDVAVSEIKNGSGSQFWPPAVEAFLQIPTTELDALASQGPDLGGSA